MTWSPPRGFVSVEKIKYRVGARDTASESIFGDFDAVTLTEKGQCVTKLKDLTPGASYAVQVWDYSGGTQGVLNGVLKGYSRGTQGVLRGH